MTSWHDLLHHWQNTFVVVAKEPVRQEAIQKASLRCGGFPDDLRDLYAVSNGFSKDWLRVLPVEDPDNMPDTWDGIQRANQQNVTKYLGRDAELLERFLVFAEIGPMQCAAFDRSNGSIWFEEKDELLQTDLSLVSFIETCLKEIAEY